MTRLRVLQQFWVFILITHLRETENIPSSVNSIPKAPLIAPDTKVSFRCYLQMWFDNLIQFNETWSPDEPQMHSMSELIFCIRKENRKQNRNVCTYFCIIIVNDGILTTTGAPFPRQASKMYLHIIAWNDDWLQDFSHLITQLVPERRQANKRLLTKGPSIHKRKHKACSNFNFIRNIWSNKETFKRRQFLGHWIIDFDRHQLRLTTFDNSDSNGEDEIFKFRFFYSQSYSYHLTQKKKKFEIQKVNECFSSWNVIGLRV